MGTYFIGISNGKADLLITPKKNAGWSGWKLFLSNGNTFTHYSSGNFSLEGEIQEVVVGDFNGDGYSDFIVKRKTNNKYYNSDIYLAQGSGNSITFKFDRCLISSNRDYGIKAAEFNGDGASDLFVYYYNSKDYRMINSEWSDNSMKALHSTLVRTGTENWDRVELGDFNGDGLTDVMNLYTDGHTLRESNGFDLSYIKKGTYPNKDHHLYMGDFNGDGKTDMLLTGWDKNPNSGGWSSWNVNFSRGDGTFERVDFTKKFNSKDKLIYVADITGDGKDDFYAVNKNGDYSRVSAYINDGTGKSFSEVSGASAYPLDKWHYYLGDFNGDGKTDFVCTANFSNTHWKGCQLFLVPQTPYNLLASITDGMGVVTEVQYKPMSDSSIHTRGTTKTYPLSSFSNTWYLVDKVYKTNGIGGKNVTSFKYKNALMHKRGRGFMGFEYFIQKDEASNVETTTEFEVNTNQFICAVKSVETKVHGRVVGRMDYTNTLKTYGDSRIFTLMPTYSRERKYEYTSGTLLSTTENTYEYDNYGNVTKLINKVGTHIITNTNIYTNDESKWHLGRLIQSVINKKNSTEDINLTTKYAYDTTSGLLVQEEFEPSDISVGYVKTYTHDKFGNIIQSKMTPKDTTQPSNTVKSRYDNSGRFIIESTDNMGMSAVNTINYDLGVILSTKDANNYVTHFEYNKFGELQVTNTDISYQQIVYRWAKGHSDAPANALFFKYSQKKGTAPVIEFYDILGRVVRTVAVGLNSQKIYADVTYNAKGQVDKTSEPYFPGQTVYWNRNTYDNVGRISRQTYADNSSYTFEYNGFLTTTTDPMGQKTVKKVDARGNLVESIDAKEGKVNYSYDVSNNCIRIVSPRTTVTSTFDKVGNKIQQKDPELGNIKYKYNAYGEILTKTVNQKTFNYQYDVGGRIIKETSPDGDVTYTYDTRWKGALTKVTSSNGTSAEYFYDTYGRLTKSIEMVDGKSLTTEMTYNAANNQQETLTYPSGLKVKNEYDVSGHLTSVKNALTNSAYWTANKKNARGQLESFTYGNNLTTNITYNAQKGYVTDISAGNLQKWSYTFNTAGNLTSRKNNLRNLTETFDYDELNRLTRVSHNGVLKQEMRYDAAGNLTYKTGVGSQFTYGSGSNRLISLTGEGYTPKEWSEIRYNAYNKITYIKSGNDSQSIVYGPTQQRKKTVTIVNGVTETKYYIGGLYEEVIKSGETKQISYVFAEGESIAIFEKSNKTGEKLLYLCKDHLGTAQALVDQAGKLVQELSYDPWGRRRDATNWQYYAETSHAKALTPHGFTGHEHLDMFDLVNMDGRMYDPVLGRFLSPDPIIQAPDFTQSLNRYIYCMNNPLSLYDPTGYSWFSRNWKSLVVATVGVVVSIATVGIGSPIGGAMIAGAIGGAAAGLTGALLNGANFGQAIASTFMGAAFGAIGGFFAHASGGGHLLERLFKHSFSQAWLEGARGGNMKHGLFAGAASVAGGQMIGKYGDSWGKVGKISANAIVSGTVAELGGGKFANGAITGAYCMMLNDLMHESSQKYKSQVNIKRLKQNAIMNCMPACAEVASAALGEEISQSKFRELAGGDPNTDMLEHNYFWKEVYVGQTGHKVDGYIVNDPRSINKIYDTLEGGGVVTLSLTKNHSVVVESVTIKLKDGNFHNMKIRIMDPGHGGFTNIKFNSKKPLVQQMTKQIFGIFYITK